jgi:hypothetical protein
MTHDLHILLALAVFGGGFYLADQISRPAAAQIVADAFHQLPSAPAHGGLCLPLSSNIEDRRDPIAVLIENN